MNACGETPERIHAFWFGEESAALDDAALAQRQAALWWRKNPEVDAAMRVRFAACIAQAAAHALDHWTATPRGRLALVLLADQFTRNVHRDTPAAFACDAQARAWSRAALDAGEDKLLRPIERVFLYLPFEHAEDMADQDRAVALFAALHGSVPPAQREPFQGFLDYAVKHREVIARFGRFPHRNAILGRMSTPEEAAFLMQPGSRF